jgi:hypothetical protein
MDAVEEGNYLTAENAGIILKCVPPSNASLDDGLSGPKHAVSLVIKAFVYVTVTSPILLLHSSAIT